VALDDAGTRCAATTGDGLVQVFDLPSGELRWQQNAHAGRVRSIAFDAAAQQLVSCGGTGTVTIWDAANGETIDSFANPTGWARCVAIDPSGSRIAIGSGTGDIYVRDTASKRFSAHLTGHAGRILMLGFAGDPDLLATASADGTVRIWSLSRQISIAETRLDASLHCAAFDQSSGRVLTGSANGLALLTLNSL
jgi:WD40 repeat protein